MRSNVSYMIEDFCGGLPLETRKWKSLACLIESK